MKTKNSQNKHKKIAKKKNWKHKLEIRKFRFDGAEMATQMYGVAILRVMSVVASTRNNNDKERRQINGIKGSGVCTRKLNCHMLGVTQ